MTIIMVTHELDIASFAKRNIIMRDGEVVSDQAVPRRLNSETELARLREAHQSVKLSA
jgi:putative ABC transport system ATP-binding protein